MNSKMVAIGVVATILIFLQHGSAGVAFGWALVHGAGPAALFAFLPLAAALLVLWVAAVSLHRRAARRAPVLFGVVAAAIVMVNEALMPGTPFKAWTHQRAIEAVTVKNIRDELIVSSRGNPIGIRLTFEAVFPSNGVYAVGYALAPDSDEGVYALQFNHSIRSTIQPEPGGSYDFRRGTVYTFSTEFLPNFLSYDERTGVTCLNDMTTSAFSEKDFLAALSKSRSLQYRTAIRLSNEQAWRPVAAAEYVTGHAYDVEAMYRTIEADGSRRCAS
jgi:hypothetical protein